MTRAARAALLVVIVLAGLVLVGGPLAIRWREPDDGAMLPADVPGRLVDVRGRRVHVVERGSGPVLLLVHGFGASTHDFEEHVLDPLAATHRVVALDLFGFGWSERRDDFAYGWPLWSDQIIGTMDALGIAKATVVGHSMGGAVGAVLAARHPERVERLVLVDAFYPPEPKEISLVFRALLTPVVGELALATVDDVSAPGFSAGHHARALAWARIRGTRRAMLQYVRDPTKLPELMAAYADLRVPTLVLHGAKDQFVTYAAMRRAAPTIPGATIVLLEGDHFPFRDDYERLVREIVAFR
jgi:pimeloyl-ACP methyl ester carboxylesterase